MKKLFLFLAALALAGCNLAGGPGASKPPTHVAITGAKGLFLQTNANKSIHAAGQATAGSGTMLMQVTAGATVGPATFTASDGSTVNVNIDAVLQVNASWLLVTYDTGGASLTAAVSMATGAMTPLAQVPNYFAQVRILGSVAYYCSGGTLYRVDVATGSATAIGSGLAGNEYLHVTPAGDVYAYGNIVAPPQIYPTAWVFPAAGGSSKFLNAYGVPTADKIGGIFGNLSIVEDQTTGDMWLMTWTPPSITVAKFVFNGITGGPGTAVQIGTTINGTNGGAIARLGSQVYFQGSVFVGNWEASTLASDGAGGLTVTQWDTSAVPQNDYLVNGQQIAGVTRYQTDGVSIYSAPCLDSNTVNLVTLPGGGGTAGDPVLVSSSNTITSFAVTGGQVLYTDSTGTYQQATTVGAKASLYSATPVTLAPVGQ